MRWFLLTTTVISEYWKKMQDDFIENKDFWRTVSQMRWFLRININSPFNKHRKFAKRVINKIRRELGFGKTKMNG